MIPARALTDIHRQEALALVTDNEQGQRETAFDLQRDVVSNRFAMLLKPQKNYAKTMICTSRHPAFPMMLALTRHHGRHRFVTPSPHGDYENNRTFFDPVTHYQPHALLGNPNARTHDNR